MITLDEYILKNHSELSEDIKCHLSVYTYSDPKACEALHRLFFTSLRQHENNELQSLKDQLAQSKKDLEKAEKVIKQYGDELNYSSDPEEYGSLSFEDGDYYDLGKKARAYFQEKQDQLKESK